MQLQFFLRQLDSLHKFLHKLFQIRLDRILCFRQFLLLNCKKIKLIGNVEINQHRKFRTNVYNFEISDLNIGYVFVFSYYVLITWKNTPELNSNFSQTLSPISWWTPN